MLNILGHTRDLIEKALSETNLKTNDYSVEFTDNVNKGDIATNVALQLSRSQNKNPKELADTIAEKILGYKDEHFKDVKVVNGFINFTLTQKAISEYLISSVNSEGFGVSKKLKGKTIFVEYTDPNPFKIFHIGHLMTNTIGESVANLFEMAGANVKRICYMGDVGKHIAKAIWAIKKLNIKNLNAENISEAYVYGTQNEKDAKEEIAEINKVIFEKEKGDIWDIYEEGKKITLADYEKLYKRLGTKFDYYIFESEVMDKGKEIVEKNIGKVFIRDEDNSVIFKGNEEDGLHTRVYLTQQGFPAYEAKELGLAFEKENLVEHHESYIVVANEVKDYFKVHLAVLSKIEQMLANKTKIIFHGVMKLTSGKMSSREGNIVSAKELIDELKEQAIQKAKENELDITEEVADKIAVSSFRYIVLKQAPNKDIKFDVEKSISFTGDSGAYILYTMARIQSLLEKSGYNYKDKNFTPEDLYLENNIVRTIIRFSDVIEKCINKSDVHNLTHYIMQLSSEFNAWYGQEKILNQEDTEKKLHTISIIFEVLKTGSKVIGLHPIEKM